MCGPARAFLSRGAAQADPPAMRSAGGTGFRTRMAWLFGAQGRGFRVVALLAVVAILSLADLYMTMTHVLSVGMLEQNPVARVIMAYGSPTGLVVWKRVTVGFAVWVMYRLRGRPSAEIGALFCVCVLTWLTFRWATYNDQVSQLTEDLRGLDPEQEPAWVTMSPGE